MINQKEFKESNIVYNKKEVYTMAKKKRTIWGVIGIILVIMGVTGSIPFAIQRQFIGVSVSAVFVIGGVILIAWAFGD